MHPARRLKPRKTATQRRSKQTVTNILEAAAQVFSKNGYEKTTTNHIAERAGVSVGTVYEYFPNKDVLLTALQSHWNDLCWKHAQAFEPPSSKLSLEELIHVLVEQWVSIFQLNPALYAMLVNDLPTRGNKWKADQRLVQTVDTISSLLKKHQDKLQIDDIELAAEVLVRGIQGYFDHLIVNEPNCFSDPKVKDRIARLACELIVRDCTEVKVSSSNKS